MQVYHFSEMPYPQVWDDHSSLRVNIPNREYDPVLGADLYERFLDEWVLCDELGLNIMVNEHHATATCVNPACSLPLAILARQTKKARLLALGVPIANRPNPVRVAEEMAMIDCISGGRLIAGFPVGTPMDTCYAFGENPSHLRVKYREAHDLVMQAWTNPDTFSFNGRYHQIPYVNIWPRPVQQPHPPVWIPGGGSVETFEWCAEMDYVYSYLSYFGYKAGLATMNDFWDTMSRLGKDRNPYRAGFLQFVGVAESKEEAMKLYKEPAEYFYGRCLHVDPRYSSPPGYTTEETMRRKYKSQVAAVADKKAESDKKSGLGTPVDMSIDFIEREGYVILGSPDEVAEKLREVAVNMNVGHLMLLLQYGNMSKDLANYNTQLFAEKVMPQIHGLFDDEWEDHWWPKPMPKEERAVPAPIKREAAE